MQSQITDLLKIKYPIIQGAMAWVADADLASAVSNAGGLGIIAAGNAEPDIVRKEIKKIRTLTDKPFGVNIMLLSPHADEVAALLIEEDIKVVTTGAGNPEQFIELFKKNNIIVIPVVPSVAYGKRMEKLGADALIAEGMEAGGHIGKLTTMALLPQVTKAVNIPVIGAGGVGDGRGLAAMLMLGAAGVQIGTRFVVAKESNAHENFKRLILKAKDIDTVITGNITGHPVRVLRNNLSKKLEKYDTVGYLDKEKSIQEFEEMGRGALRKAVVDGNTAEGSFMAGQIAGLIDQEQTCRDMIEEMIKECKETINSVSGCMD